MLWVVALQILYLELLGCISDTGLQLHIWAMCLSNPYQFDAIKFSPWFQTAGFGVFAGRAFKPAEPVLRSWRTIYLPHNLPRSEVVRNYVFDHNETHTALALDYGSLANHHKSANVKFVSTLGSEPNLHFQVRRVFNVWIAMVYKYMHARAHTNTHTQRIPILVQFVHTRHFQGHKRHRGWTGAFYSLWQRAVV